ncbi:MAG: metal-dependent transcriptional regulator [Acidimicrobiaceae bacterium]|nr:metal-dependent transcriptional regulator [Acidimicrobiaceae bacterium]MYE96584.1 metal-dependent transcriptional regulator [Acidimicrobiaceae bacterium]MYI53515.1 metal-dependent transcriptional regulator [Acidimicrobiaceae bacterium]
MTSTTAEATPYESPEWHPAFEEYCETIFELAEDDLDVIQARIADRLEISRPAVSEMIRRMQAEGLVEEGRGTIKLTPRGHSLAETVVRRHRLAECFLTDILGLSWAEAHQEAGKWEHIISPAVEKAMIRVLEQPTTCPHGNPIPGSGYEAPDMVPLDSLDVGRRFTVQRIPEELEFQPGMLEFLEGAQVTPGSTGTVTARSPDGTFTLDVEGGAVGLSDYATARILVAAAPAD